MTDIKMKKIYLLEDKTLDEIFCYRNLAEVIEYLQGLTDVPPDEVQICHEAYYDESDKISMWYERPETEEERLHRESIEAAHEKRRIELYLGEYKRSKRFLAEAGLLDPDTGNLVSSGAESND